MPVNDEDLSKARMPWLRSSFDLEGYVGALAAWLAGILLGLIWGPLFWIGFAAAVIILLATRTAIRTPPVGDGLIIAPCDGVVASVSGAAPPVELRLEGSGWTRVRISVGPTSANGVFAPMDGAIDHVIRETGDPAAFAATSIDRPGLSVAYVAFASASRSIGIRIATGGLGPRLEIASQPGDAVRMGRNIGTLRLGGWCDVYLPAETSIMIRPGQTLTGAETVIARFDGAAVDLFEPEPEAEPAPARTAAPVAPRPAPEIKVQPPEPEVAPAPEPQGPEAEASQPDVPTASSDPEDVSEMFKRLRKEARKAQKPDISDPE